jgi:hypothetical protein
VNGETASQQTRASIDPFGYARSRVQITQFGVESGSYLGDPGCRTDRRISRALRWPGVTVCDETPVLGRHARCRAGPVPAEQKPVTASMTASS